MNYTGQGIWLMRGVINMTNKTFIIQFNDLKFEKQQEMIGEVKEVLLADYQDEAEFGRFGKNFGRDEYKDMTWQEACVREYAVDFRLWEDKDDAKKFDWNFSIENYAEEEAQKECERAMTYNKVEVEI